LWDSARLQREEINELSRRQDHRLAQAQMQSLRAHLAQQQR